MNLLFDIPSDIGAYIAKDWCTLRDIVFVDTAIASKFFRTCWLNLLTQNIITNSTIIVEEKDFRKLMWLMKKKIFFTKIIFRQYSMVLEQLLSEERLWTSQARHLQIFKFHDRCEFKSGKLVQILGHCSDLEEIELHICEQASLNSGVFQKLLIFPFKNLRIFTLIENYQLQDFDFIGLVNHCPNIQQLHLEQCSLTGKCIPHIAAGLRRLMKLTLKSCRIIHSHRPSMLQNQPLVSECQKIIAGEWRFKENSCCSPILLDFSHTIGIGDYILPFILKFYSKRIERLNVSYCHLQNVHLNLIRDFCTSMTALLIPGSSVTDDQLIPLLTSCRNLETLILGLCPNLSELSILSIAKYLKHLKTFALWGNFLALNDENAETFSRACVGLEKVTFTLTGISDIVLRKLFQNCCISRIEINRCRLLTDYCMQAVLEHSNNRLTHFVAENVYFTDIACAALSQCPTLQHLNLSHSKFITSFGICSILKNCHRLGVLKIKNCSSCKFDEVIEVMCELQNIKLHEFDASDNFCKTIKNLVSLVEQCDSLSKLVLVNCFPPAHHEQIALLTSIANIKKIILCI